MANKNSHEYLVTISMRKFPRALWDAWCAAKRIRGERVAKKSLEKLLRKDLKEMMG